MPEVPKGLLARAGLVGVPLPPAAAREVISASNYRPEPPEACECGIVRAPRPRAERVIMATSVSWKKCTSFGSLDSGPGPFPLIHARIGKSDYLFTALQMRACRRIA